MEPSKLIKSICVFCGSSKGNNRIYSDVVTDYIKLIVKQGVKVVYGGGNIGIMGVVAQAVKDNNGYIIGVAPSFLEEKEVVHKQLDQLLIVKDMFERKQKLMELSDAFVVLPGGIGTLDEFFEVFTALQLEVINKPIAILNTNGYYNNLVLMLQNMVEAKFLHKEHFENLIIEDSPKILHEKLMKHQTVSLEKWISELRNKQHF